MTALSLSCGESLSSAASNNLFASRRVRERREDIPLLVENILSRFNRENHTKISMTPEALHVLTSCQWPGNVRELENCVARFSTLSHSNVIQSTDIPCQTNNCLSSSLWKYRPQHTIIPITPEPDSPRHPASMTTVDANNQPQTQREHLLSAMEKSGWVQAKAARLLNLTPRQMGYALKKNHIELKKF